MRAIMPKITSLYQYLTLVAEDPHQFCPERCLHCGKAGLTYHGCYYRKSDRENVGDATLNPIPITRFLCGACGRTCSVLPECIPPRRWYTWKTQQSAITHYLSNMSFRNIASMLTPSRRTVARWWYRLKARYPLHRLHLCSRFPYLGKCDNVTSFWQRLLSTMTLSSAMWVLNAADVLIP